MSRIIRVVAGLFLVFIVSVCQGSAQQQDPCDPNPPVGGYQKLAIDGPTGGRISGSLQYKNDDQVWVVVENVNPFVTSYSIKTTRKPATETAIGAFLTLLGGIDADVSSSSQKNPSPPSPKPTPQPGERAAEVIIAPCDDALLNAVVAKVDDLRAEEVKVNQAVNHVAGQYRIYTTDYAKALDDVKGETKCSGIKAKATVLRQTLAKIQTPDQLRGDNFGGTPSDEDPIQILRASVVQLRTHAKDLQKAILEYRRKAASDTTKHPLCEENKNKLDSAERFIDEVIGDSSDNSEVQALSGQLNKLNTLYSQFSQTKATVEKAFGSQDPTLVTKVVTDNQSDVEIVVETGPPVIGAPIVAGPSPKPNLPTTQVFDTTIHFGYGPRFTLSAGLVVSFLQNRQFTTANGQVAYQNNADTRILPIAQLNARIRDCNPDTRPCLWIPQISVGITAKADDKGTAPEYLIGPSWAFVKRQLFLTVGAYAGQQQRLLGGLQVGQATTLSAANLPIAKEYHWSGAVAITWKIK